MVNQPLGVERFFSALRCLFVNEIIASERTLSEDGLMMTRPPFDLQQLRCLVVLSETLHFGRAALRLNMTQPPLSRQIALLEESMGVRLFQRDRRTVTLTSAGRYFVEEARAILQRAGEAAVQARLAAEGGHGSLTRSASPSPPLTNCCLTSSACTMHAFRRWAMFSRNCSSMSSCDC